MRIEVKRIRARYVLALSLIAVLATTSAWILNGIIGKQAEDARTINVAGIQRMLSQKISLYVHAIQLNPEDADAEKQLLRDAINSFQSNHLHLTQKDLLQKSNLGLSKEIKALYYKGESSLDHRIRHYIEAAELALHGKFTSEQEGYFKSEFVEALLNDLNGVVTQFEKEANDRIAIADTADLSIWLVTMALLLVEAVFIFRPMRIAIGKALDRADAQRELAEKYLRKAEKASKIKSQFLAKMSHELRTPLNSVSATIQAVQEENISKETKSLVNLAENSVSDLLTIFDDLLDVTRVDDQPLDLILSDFNLHDLINEAISYHSELAAKKGLSIQLEDTDLLQECWLGDQRRIVRILSNLISNAVKFTEQGGVRISVRMKETERTEKELIFRVEDTGVGIAPDTQQRMFKKFEQGDNSASRKYGGVGLGLTIAKHLADIMQGSIDIESAEGEGTTAVLTLPLIPSRIMKSQHKTNGENILNLEGMDILIAEDNLINQMVIMSLLEHTKATIRMAENGEQAVSLFKDKKPDLVLMDIQMPVKDGIDACIEIKDLDSSVPVIAVTANVTEEDQRDYDEAGFDSLVSKPIQNEVLLSEICNKFNGNI